MAPISKVGKRDLPTNEDICGVLDIEDESDIFSEESDDFWFDTSEEDSDTSSIVHESEPSEEARSWMDTNPTEMKPLIGLLILQGIVQKPENGMYFSEGKVL
jgi:hypothetical protein